MAFYKKKKQKVNGLWYPMAVTVGKPVNTDEVADRLAQIAGVRVRFIPEARRSGSGRNMVRSLISDNIFWVELPADAKTTDPGQGGGGDSESPDEI